ncbi:MAG: peptide chain release factor 1 [Bacteroidia bacterium]|nr:peptide chain release factor 1 [Bacteroidia bacterium]HQV00073.1 peptide chain release factor 1 [Bacteroidia bacterium]
MLDKLEAIEIKFKEIEDQLSAPDVISDMKRFAALNRQYKEIKGLVEKTQEYKLVLNHYDEAHHLLNTEKDDDIKEMAKAELETLEEKRNNLEDEIRYLLIPADPEDSKNAIFEIRAGTGGDEASIFAGDLYRMYTRYCEARGWKLELVDYSAGSTGGYKEIIFNILGEGSYGILKYESGVHRVQRVPLTETQGRVHTSAATVAVLPEADEFDVEVKEADIRKDYFCSSGPGGQSVNTTYSAVRLTHIPTGIVVQCQDEKSQIKNYAKALGVLRSRIYEVELQKRQDEIAKKRKTMVSSGDRSAKIRTYNYAQSRVTDHRIGLSTFNLPGFMDGDIQSFIDALQLAENAEKLKEAIV